jgi:hypothetical protein
MKEYQPYPSSQPGTYPAATGYQSYQPGTAPSQQPSPYMTKQQQKTQKRQAKALRKQAKRGPGPMGMEVGQ